MSRSLMRPYLTGALYAPIGAMGAMVAGPTRAGWSRPGRSAILGLVGAALGIDRADEDALLALDRGLGLAMLVESPGTPFLDFHTTQVVGGTTQHRTRAAEIAAIRAKDKGHRECILTRAARELRAAHPDADTAAKQTAFAEAAHGWLVRQGKTNGFEVDGDSFALDASDFLAVPREPVPIGVVVSNGWCSPHARG
jgi:hypothetical protein